MCKLSDQYNLVCKKEFVTINDKIDKLTDSIVGNGKPGLNIRVDRLEQVSRGLCRAMWLVFASVIVGVAGMFWQLFTVVK